MSLDEKANTILEKPSQVRFAIPSLSLNASRIYWIGFRVSGLGHVILLQ